MAQPIFNYRVNPSEEILALSSTERGLGAMTQPNPGMPNMMDGGKTSNPFSNAQIQRNALLSQQNLRQNAITAQTQAVADVRGQARNSVSTQSTQESRAQQYMNQNLANAIEASQTGGAGLMTLNSIMEGPQGAKFVNDIAVSKTMAEPAGKAPELGLMMKMMNA